MLKGKYAHFICKYCRLHCLRGVPANAEGQPVPRSRNKEGAPNPGNAGAGSAKKIPGVSGTGTPVAGATPAVGGA